MGPGNEIREAQVEVREGGGGRCLLGQKQQAQQEDTGALSWGQKQAGSLSWWSGLWTPPVPMEEVHTNICTGEGKRLGLGLKL